MIRLFSKGGGGGPATVFTDFVDWTLDTTPDYTAIDQMGDIEEFDGALADGGVLGSIFLIDDDKINFDVDLLIFNSLPTLTSVDNGILAMTVANLKKIVARVEIRECDWSPLSGQVIADVSMGTPIKSAAGSDSLFVIMQAAETINIANAGAVSIALGIIND